MVDQEITLHRIPAAGDLDKPAVHPHARDGHLILGKRAGLIGTDDRGRAQGFHRSQATDERMPLDHLLHTQRQADGHNGRQAFRYGGDGQADRHHEQTHNHFVINIGKTGFKNTHREHQGAHHQTGISQGSTQCFKTFLQRCFFFLHALQHASNQP